MAKGYLAAFIQHEASPARLDASNIVADRRRMAGIGAAVLDTEHANMAAIPWCIASRPPLENHSMVIGSSAGSSAPEEDRVPRFGRAPSSLAAMPGFDQRDEILTTILGAVDREIHRAAVVVGQPRQIVRLRGIGEEICSADRIRLQRCRGVAANFFGEKESPPPSAMRAIG
jgi:hypothetical protein